MGRNILAAHEKKRGLVFDPRTKLFFLMTMSIFVLGGMGQEGMVDFSPILSVIPFVLLFLTGKVGKTTGLFFIYVAVNLLHWFCTPSATGIWGFLLYGSVMILTKFMPTIVAGMYLMTTTTVSEFTAAMLRMHIPEQIIIPVSVMFRFFPSVADEASSIHAAMKMRDIRLGGKNIGKLLEYRIIPLITCSVKLGEELSAAALTRGLGGDVKRTNICRIGFHVQDILLIVLCGSAYVAYGLAALGIRGGVQ